MKKIMLGLILLSTVLFGEMEIVFNKKFEIKLTPNLLNVNISFSVQKQSQSNVTTRLTNISQIVKNEKIVKSKGGEYNINPHYLYENGKNIQNGYDGTITYNLSSNNPEILNKFIRELQNVSEKNGMTATISSTFWSVENDEISGDLHIENLRIEAMKWAEQYEKLLLTKLGKSCSVSKINFTDTQRFYNQPMMLRSMATMQDQAPVPTQDEQSFSVNGNFVMICK